MEPVLNRNMYKTYLIGSELNFNTFSKMQEFQQIMYEKYTNKNSNYFLKRSLYSYMKINSIASDDFRNTEFINEIGEIAKIILTPFIGFNPETGEKASFHKPSGTKIAGVITRAKAILSRIFETPDINFIFDFSKMSTNENKSLKIYIDKLVPNNDNLMYDPIDYTKKNGFIKFVSPKNVMMTVVVPVDFLESLASKNLLIVPNNSATTSQRPQPYDILTGNGRFVSMRSFQEDFARAFFQTYIIALYRERYRENLYSQMYLILRTIKAESGFESANSRLKTDKLWENFKNKYINTFIEFGLPKNESSNNEITMTSPDLFTILNEVFYRNNIFSVNPVDIYNKVFELGVYECSNLARQLGFSPIISGLEFIRYEGNLSELNRDLGSEYSNLVAQTLITRRLIPVMFLSEFVIGLGEKHSEVNEIVKRIKMVLTRLIAKSSLHPYSMNLKNTIDNISKDVDFNKIVSNSLLRNDFIRRIIKGEK